MLEKTVPIIQILPTAKKTKKIRNQVSLQIARTVYRLIATGRFDDIQEKQMIPELEARGFNKREIQGAFDWIEKVTRSGFEDELFALSAVQVIPFRTPHSLEVLCIPQAIYFAIYRVHRQGLISLEQLENTFEGLRIADPRDWDDSDIESFWDEWITTTFEGIKQEFVHRFVHEISTEQLCS